MLTAVLLWVGTGISAAEPGGTIQAVDGERIKVVADFEFLPKVGDRLEILVKVPDVGMAQVGTAIVTTVRGDFLLAKIERATGKIATGQRVRLLAGGEGVTPAPTAPGAGTPATPPDPPAAGDPTQPASPAPSSQGTAAKMTTTAQMRGTLAAIATVLKQDHYSGHPLDAEIADRTLDGYLRAIDPAKMYFTRSDVDQFQRRARGWEQSLKSGDANLAFDLFRVFVERLNERIAWVNQLLDDDHDFTVDESIVINADHADYAADQRDAQEKWRKRVKYELLTRKADGLDAEEARRQIASNYRNYQKRMQQANADEVFAMLANALLTAFDPHSSYYSPRTFADQQIMVKREMFGIGAALQVKDGFVTVNRLIPNGPADRDGRLQVGDRIIGVGQDDHEPLVDVTGMKLPDVVNKIRGSKDTVVRLRVVSPGQFESSVYQLTRGKVDLAELGTAVLSGDQLPGRRPARVGYVYMPMFYTDMKAQQAGEEDYRSSTRDLKPLLAEFATDSVDVVVLDIRSNTGGSLTEAINTTGLFVGDGPVVQVKDRRGQIQTYSAQGIDIAWSGPFVVLTGRYSAGGAEILAGAVQDYHRGLIIGDDRTTGMGTVGTLVDIGKKLFTMENSPNFGYLKHTTQKFYRPGGQGIQMRGVASHVVLPSLAGVIYGGEADNRYALAFDAIPSAKFEKFDFGVSEALTKVLDTRSRSRQSQSAWFDQWNKKLAHAKANRELVQVSLNEQAFLARRKKWPDAPDFPAMPGIPQVKMDPYLNEALAIALDYTSRARLTQATSQWTQRQYAAAVDSLKAAVRADPENASAHYLLAWNLSTCPNHSFRDGELATRHATRACELSDFKTWNYALTLSLAEAEAGKFDDAVKHLRQALDMAPASVRPKYEFLETRFRSGRSYGAR